MVSIPWHLSPFWQRFSRWLVLGGCVPHGAMLTQRVRGSLAMVIKAAAGLVLQELHLGNELVD